MKNQLSKSLKVIETKDSLLRQCYHYPALAMTALATMLFFASSLGAGAQFLTYPCATATHTFACFQVNVNPNFAWLLNPGSGAASNPYPGWSSPNLTSPGMQDEYVSQTLNQTVIGESAGLAAPPTSISFPIQIGDTACVVSNTTVGLYNYIMNATGPSSFASYSYPSFGWQYHYGSANPATLTEIEYFTITSNGGGSTGTQCPPGTSSLYPPQTSGQDILLKAGYQNLGDPARRSIGMIVSHSSAPVGNTLNFPAESFFNVFVELTLPVVNTTVSAAGGYLGSQVFPAGGALLINDSAHPLIVTTDPLIGFPGDGGPPIFYFHDPATPAVPLVFEYDNPNTSYDPNNALTGPPYYWHKGDTFGWIQLAGHGVFNPCAKSTQNWDAFMTATLGGDAHANPAAPVGGVVSTANYPFPTCTYSTEQGTNFGGHPWDAITFSNTTSISGAFLTLSNFQMSVALPAFGSSVTYTNTNTVANISWSLDSLTSYVPTQSTGTVVVQITNTNTPVNGVTTYNTTLLQCSFAGFANFGQWALQLDTTKPNTGLHMVQALGHAGFRITGYFDSRFQVSANGGASWTESDAPNRLYLGGSPCGADIEPIHCKLSGSNVIIDWSNPSYSLQGSTSLNPAVWVPIGSGSPVTLPANTPYKFFQLSCE